LSREGAANIVTSLLPQLTVLWAVEYTMLSTVIENKEASPPFSAEYPVNKIVLLLIHFILDQFSDKYKN